MFVQRKPGSGKVYRHTKGERDMRLPLYASAGRVPGEFGKRTHVHMYTTLPKRSGI